MVVTDTENWLMTVRKGDRTLYQGYPRRSDAFPRVNVAGIFQSQALVKVSEPWSPGTYEVSMAFTNGPQGPAPMTDVTHRVTMTFAN
jgi:hypothetical protein